MAEMKLSDTARDKAEVLLARIERQPDENAKYRVLAEAIQREMNWWLRKVDETALHRRTSTLFAFLAGMFFGLGIATVFAFSAVLICMEVL